MSRPQKYNSIKERLIKRIKDTYPLGAQRAADAIYSFFESPVAFLQKDMQIQANSASEPEAKELSESLGMVSGERRRTIGRYYYCGKYYYLGHAGPQWPGICFVVFSSDSPTVLDELKETLVEAELLLIEEKTTMETEDELYYNTLSLLLSGTKLDNDIIDTLNKRSLLNNGSFCLIYISPCAGQQIKQEFLEAVKNTRGIDLKFCMVNNPIRKEAIAILRFKPQNEKVRSEFALRAIIEEVECAVEENKGTERIYISNRYSSFNRLEQSYHEAVIAKAYNQIICEKYRPGFFSELYPYYLILNSDIAPAYLDDIEALERAGHSLSFNALDTLEAFLRCGSYKTAAAELYIHENTLRYRIKKIRDLLCINFDDLSICRDFILRINLWKLKNKLYENHTAQRKIW